MLLVHLATEGIDPRRLEDGVVGVDHVKKLQVELALRLAPDIALLAETDDLLLLSGDERSLVGAGVREHGEEVVPGLLLDELGDGVAHVVRDLTVHEAAATLII